MLPTSLPRSAGAPAAVASSVYEPQRGLTIRDHADVATAHDDVPAVFALLNDSEELPTVVDRKPGHALPSGLRSTNRMAARGFDCASGRHAASIVCIM
jgi:hypothetical protein